MLSKEIFINKRILVYGLGLSGNSCLKYLNKKNKVTIFDDNNSLKTKKNKNLFSSIKIISKTQFDFIVISPGIDIKNCKLKNFLIKNKEKIITELDVFHLIFPKNIKITITGTNGKSTTCRMIYDIFKSNNFDVKLVGNIGKPPLEEKNISKRTIFIVEASSYQISYSKYFKTDYGAILNLSVDHLERHRNLNEYAKSKLKLIYSQDKKKYSYIEKNNKIIKKNLLTNKVKSNLYKITYNKTNFFEKKIKNPYLLDKNNLNNIHFVYILCKKFGILDNKIFNQLNKFRGLRYRKQIIYNTKNLKIINDSKSTSFSSTIGLLSTYENIYWIVGGVFKKGDKFDIDKKYYNNIKAYIIGRNKNFFKNEFRNKIKNKNFINLKKAIFKIKKDIKKDKKNKTILFSPAAASFDQFKNFEQRGQYFNQIVKKEILKNDY